MEKPRLAGISSFGFGGSNAHIIVQEAPKTEKTVLNQTDNQKAKLITLSAESDEALSAQLNQLKVFTQLHTELNLEDISYSLATTRNHFSKRAAFVVSNKEDISSLRLNTSNQSYKITQTALLFTGQGAQYWQMGKGLYEHFPYFKTTFDHCAELIKVESSIDIKKNHF